MESAKPRPTRTIREHIAHLSPLELLLYVLLSAVLLAPYVLFGFYGEHDVLGIGTMAFYTWFMRAVLRAFWRGEIY